MVKLHDVIRECGFDHAVETEIVKFLFPTHNQNSHVREELLKNMKDGDSLNTTLGYAKHVEGTQHSEHLSKVYLDTIKIPNSNVKVEAISPKQNGSNKRQNSKHRSQSKSKPEGNCCNCGTNHPPKKCPAWGKICYSCNKKGHFKPYCRSRQRSQRQGKQRSNSRQSRCDQHKVITNNRDQNDDSNWFQYEQDSVQVLFSQDICSDINSKSNIQFDESDGKGVQCVLTDLTLIKAMDLSAVMPVQTQWNTLITSKLIGVPQAIYCHYAWTGKSFQM